MGAARDALNGRRSSAALLLELCEEADGEISGAVLADHFREAGRRLKNAGLLELANTQTTVTCRECEACHPAEVEFDGRTRSYRHFCGESGWVEVRPPDLRSYRVDFTRVTEELARTLNLQRPVCLIEGILWELGEGRLGNQAWTALFGRRLGAGRNLDEAVRVLAQRAGKSAGLLLTSCEISPHITLPGGHRPLPLRICLSISPQGLVLDHGLIIAALSASTTAGKKRSGMPGRPSSKEVYLTEHAHRIATGKACEELGKEAKELQEWMRRTHPLLPASGLGTIKNNIRSQHRAWKAQR